MQPHSSATRRAADQEPQYDDAQASQASSPYDAAPAYSFVEHLPADSEVPDEVLEFFIPEAEEHLQAVMECLLALEARPNVFHL